LDGKVDDEESYRYLLSRKPGLSAFRLRSGGRLNRTAEQIQHMGELQYLNVRCRIDGSTMRAMFENANFGRLRTLGFGDLLTYDSAALKTMALACPQLQQLFLCAYTRPSPPVDVDDGTIKFVLESCPELRVVFIDSLEAITGEGWLDNIGTLLPRVQCIVLAFCDSKSPSPELLQRADRARALNPKLCILVDKPTCDSTYQYNEEVIISRHDVWDAVDAMPRLCDLEARRVRFPNVLQAAARFRLGKAEERARRHSFCR
jgi:hypothetical protein